MKSLKAMFNAFSRNNSYTSLFSSAVSESFKDVFSEMGYSVSQKASSGLSYFHTIENKSFDRKKKEKNEAVS